MPEIIEMIKTLIEKGHAYEVNGSVFYDTKSFPDYGKLSGKNIDDLEAGARIEVDTTKKSPMDFVLWSLKSQANQHGNLLGAKVDQVGTLNVQ